MSLFRFIKQLKRSGSWKYAKDYHSQTKELHSWKYQGTPVYYRPGTSDHRLIWDILIQRGHKAEYWVPKGLNPTVILDIGANVGVAAVFFANLYPEAKIYCFEPIKENFLILEKNIAPYSNVQAFNFGLGAKDDEFTVFTNLDTTNLGGFSIYELPNDSSHAGTIMQKHSEKIKICHMKNFLQTYNIDHVDIIKIDTEGAEYDILSSMPRDLLNNSQWILGELHGIKNFATLAILDESHDISMKKNGFGCLFTFCAFNRSLKDKN